MEKVAQGREHYFLFFHRAASNIVPNAHGTLSATLYYVGSKSTLNKDFSGNVNTMQLLTSVPGSGVSRQEKNHRATFHGMSTLAQ